MNGKKYAFGARAESRRLVRDGGERDAEYIPRAGPQKPRLLQRALTAKRKPEGTGAPVKAREHHRRTLFPPIREYRKDECFKEVTLRKDVAKRGGTTDIFRPLCFC